MPPSICHSLDLSRVRSKLVCSLISLTISPRYHRRYLSSPHSSRVYLHTVSFVRRDSIKLQSESSSCLGHHQRASAYESRQQTAWSTRANPTLNAGLHENQNPDRPTCPHNTAQSFNNTLTPLRRPVGVSIHDGPRASSVLEPAAGANVATRSSDTAGVMVVHRVRLGDHLAPDMRTIYSHRKAISRR